MLRMVLIAVFLSTVVKPAWAQETTYDRNLNEYLYDQCLATATANRNGIQPPLSREEIREVAAKDCEAQQPVFLKMIDGETVKDRYNRCLSEAMDRRTALIPPQPFLKVILQTFVDCKDLERLYLGLSSDSTDATASEQIIKMHRAEKLAEKEKENLSSYTPNIGVSVALLLSIEKACQNVSKERIAHYVNPMLKIINQYVSIPDDGAHDMETTLNPMIEFQSDIQTKGQQVWCMEARQKLKTAGVNDVFLK